MRRAALILLAFALLALAAPAGVAGAEFPWGGQGYPNATCDEESHDMLWVWTGGTPTALSINGADQPGSWEQQGNGAWHFFVDLDGLNFPPVEGPGTFVTHTGATGVLTLSGCDEGGATPTPTPSIPASVPGSVPASVPGSIPQIEGFVLSTCPAGHTIASGQSLIRIEHPILLLLVLNVRIDGQLATVEDVFGDGSVGDILVTPGLHTWSISNAADTEVLASGEIECPECFPPSGTPVASVPDTAGLFGSQTPISTLIFMVILVASLGALAYANVRSVRRRT